MINIEGEFRECGPTVWATSNQDSSCQASLCGGGGVRRSSRLATTKTPAESALPKRKKSIKPVSKRSHRRSTVFRDNAETPRSYESDPGTMILSRNTGASHEESDGIASSDGDTLGSSAGESEEEDAATPIFSPTTSKKQQSPAAKGRGASRKRAGHAQDDTIMQRQSREKGAEKGMIVARRPNPRRHDDAKKANASGDSGLNDPAHPLYAMLLKLVDNNTQSKSVKSIDLRKDRWTRKI